MEFACIHPEKQKKKKSYTNSGVVSVKSCKVTATKVPRKLLKAPVSSGTVLDLVLAQTGCCVIGLRLFLVEGS